MPSRRKPAEPPSEAQLLALRAEMTERFGCKSWEADAPAADGTVEFRCDCGAATGRYASHAEGERILGEHLDAVHDARVTYFKDWFAEHDPDAGAFFTVAEPEQRRSDHIADRLRRQPRPKPQWIDDFPRVGGPYHHEPGPQYGLAHLLRDRLSMVGVVSTPIAVLAERLGLRVEQSFGDSYDCEIAYFEHDSDAFTVVRWAPTQDVEVSAYVPRGEDGRGLPQLERFLAVAGLTWADVIHPRPGNRTPRPVIET